MFFTDEHVDLKLETLALNISEAKCDPNKIQISSLGQT